MNKEAVWVFVFVICSVLVYHFVYRPMQMDKKLDECFEGKYVTWEVDIKEYQESCLRKYGPR